MALLAWGGISLAAVSGAAVVYAHGGFGGQDVTIVEAEAAPRPTQAVAAVAAQPAAVAVARKPVRIIETARTPIEKPVDLVALPAVPTQSPAPAAALEPPVAETPPVEARLPKPRPEPPLITASIPEVPREPVAAPNVVPRPTAVVRRPVYIGGYPVQRPRYYYRYRAPVF